METPSSSPSSLQELKPGMAVRGRVTRIELSGAVIDVGVGTDGLVHLSRLKKGRVNRVDEVVQVGQQVEAWVERVDPAAGRLDLTMIRPMAFEWRDLRPGVRATGRVISLERYGAFVDIGAERAGLVHVSEMGEGYVSRPEDIVKVNDEIEVVVLEADSKKKQIRLSMKAAQAVDLVEEPEDEAPVATEMEIALRRAMEGKSEPSTTRERGTPSAKSRRAQDDILARTLETRAKTTSSQ